MGDTYRTFGILAASEACDTLQPSVSSDTGTAGLSCVSSCGIPAQDR